MVVTPSLACRSPAPAATPSAADAGEPRPRARPTGVRSAGPSSCGRATGVGVRPPAIAACRRRGQKSARPKIASAAGTSVIATSDGGGDGDGERPARAPGTPRPARPERHQAGGQDRPAGDARSASSRRSPAWQRPAASSPRSVFAARVREVEDDVVGDDAEHERDEQGPQERRLLEPGALGGVADRLLRQRVPGADGREREQRGTQGSGSGRRRAARPGSPSRPRSAAARRRRARPRAPRPGGSRWRPPSSRSGRCRPGSGDAALRSAVEPRTRRGR